MDRDEAKQLTYNLYSICRGLVQKEIILNEGDPLEASIDTTKLPSTENHAAHLEIGTRLDSSPVFLFAWCDGSLFIRRNLNVFTIPQTYIQQARTPVVKIKLMTREGSVVCLYSDTFQRTADKSTRYPENVIATQKTLESLENIKGNQVTNALCLVLQSFHILLDFC